MQAITAEMLQEMEGVHAKCLTGSTHKYQSINETTIVLPNRFVSRKNPVKWLYAQWNYARLLKKWMSWADVLHYTWSSAYHDARDLKWAKEMNKPVFIEWVGSDIRDPVFLSGINPYYKHALNNGYEYRDVENGEHKKKVQQQFAEFNGRPLLCPEISLYLNKSLFPEHTLLMQRVNISEFVAAFPSGQNYKPLIVHSPSAKIAKGSNIIIQVIEELKKDFDFEFKLLHDLERNEVLKIISKADIFLDQIIIGSYGMATMEALAYGKPVMCYLMPEVFAAGLPAECPIVNVNPDNLKEQLIKLVSNPQLRNDIGKQSRAYAEKYHDVAKVSKQLLHIYSEAIEAKKKKNA